MENPHPRGFYTSSLTSPAPTIPLNKVHRTTTFSIAPERSTYPWLTFSDAVSLSRLKGRKGGRLRDHLLELNNYSYRAHAKSKRSRFITLFQAATKSFTNFSFESADA